MPNLSMRGGEVTEGFLIRRLTSPAEVNKENLVGPVMRRRRSLLPEWYPRTPLRDITGIVIALERRRIQLQAAQMSREREASPENPLEPTVTDQTPLADSTPTTAKGVISFSSPVEHPLPTPSTSSSPSSLIDQSPTNTSQQSEATKKLCRSIDQIEKITSKNLKKTTMKKEASDKKRVMQRTTLMSMR